MGPKNRLSNSQYSSSSHDHFLIRLVTDSRILLHNPGHNTLIPHVGTNPIDSEQHFYSSQEIHFSGGISRKSSTGEEEVEW